MVKRIVMLHNSGKAEDFVNMLSKYPYEMDFGSGSNVVDAKSMLGVLSFDLSKPIELTIHASNEDCTELFAELKNFML